MAGGLFGYLADYLLWCFVYVSLLVHTWCFFKLFPRKSKPKLSLVLGNVLVFACLLGTAALATETYLRFLSIKTDAFGMTLPARRWFVLYTDLNSLGCRDKEWARDKPPGVRRIAFVGDSFTYGWGIEQAIDRFPDRVEAMLDARRPGSVEVLNVAKPGWDTGEQLTPIRDMIEAYAVDEVVLCYVPNDIEKLLPTTDDFDPTVPPESSFFNTDSSALVDYLYRRVYTPHIATVRSYHDWLAEGYADPRIWPQQQDHLRQIIRLCNDKDVTLRVVLLPFILTSGQQYDEQRIHLLLGDFFAANDTPVVDLLPALSSHARKDLTVNSHDPHPNEEAQELFARRIWEAFYAAPAKSGN